MRWIVGFWLFMNLVTYISFGLDKRRAQKGQWRISEKRLLWLSAFGGAIGGWRGMKDFRHKTNKNSFRILIPLSIVIQTTSLYWIAFHWIEPTTQTVLLLFGAIVIHIVLFFVLSRR